MSDLGVLCILPTILVFVMAIITRKTTLSLVAASLFASVLLSGWSFGKTWVEAIYGVMRSDLWIWIVLVCGFFGSLVCLFEKSGGIYGFDQILAKICGGRKSTLLTNWFLGLILFVDDWLSILTNGNAMKRIADRHSVPREMLAYNCNTMASGACVLVPVSTWGVFMISQLVATGLAEPGNEISAFVDVLPYMIYPMASVICSLLFSIGVIPVFGPMRGAFRQAEEKNRTGAEHTGSGQEEDGEKKRVSSPLNFLIPIIVIITISLVTGEILYGALTALVVCAVMYLPQKLMSFSDYLANIVKGFTTMVPLIFIMTSAFMLRDLNDKMNMPDYVIGAVKDSMSPELLPVISFVIILFLGVAAANFWGLCAIAFPVIIPIAHAVGADIMLTAGAIISATTACSQLCFFGSEAALTCQTTEVENTRYFKTAGTLMALPVVISALLYLVIAWI